MMTHAAATPIAPTDRVSDVLSRDESLVDVFVRHAPHFTKLRNKAMRRVMARLLTVEQAARTAGIPADVLVRDLNAALGVAPAEGTAAAATADDQHPPNGKPVETRTHPPDAPLVELDVREDLRSGREPFSKVMAAASALAGGDVLHLRAIFEPAPLFSVLGKRGFVHESREHSPDDWSVWFWRPDAASAASTSERMLAPAAAVAAAATDEGNEHEIVLDVRGLEPPEPLIRTLAALETLPAGHVLLQVNVRVPQFLIPMLGERGYACEIDESPADRVLVRIWRVG
ncbi:MAG TPA: DUF2249 domain-containing protein [Gemmatimonadaceae bacterium]|jgi:hypothetical protein